MSVNQIPVYDVIIIGAGISGICAGYHTQDKCPNKSFLILEARAAMGGTWDLFKYPGIRSDSDMYTLGFPFFPWKNPKAIADGPSILSYIKETAKEFNLDSKIRYNHKVTDASWDSKEKMWTIEIKDHADVNNMTIKTKFIFACSGYYNYDEGFTPDFKGIEDFRGTVLHPQKWDTNLDYTDKKVIVIGSGATAVTLVPEMSKKANQVTMLQRSPTYIFNMPSEDIIANFFKKIFPAKTAHSLSRRKNVQLSIWIYKACKKWPDKMAAFFKKKIKKELGELYKEEDFSPKYNPWDQRLCLVPDNDLFDAMKSGKAKIVTDTIDRFTEKGILLNSGKELEADIIVTATGLKIQLIGGVKPKIDGKEVHTGKLHAYKGAMFGGVPNMAFTVGYTNASWTLKCDLNCSFASEVLKYMDDNNYEVCTPKFDPQKFATEPLLDFDAGYIKRSLDILPKQGDKAPWKVYQNYHKDVKMLNTDTVDDKYLEYS